MNKQNKPLTATEIKNRWKFAAENPSLFPEYKYVSDRVKAMQDAILTPLIAKIEEILKRNGRL